MNERDSAEHFNRAWEDKKRGVKSQPGDLPEPIAEALEAADRLARADYSEESNVRESLRQQFLSEPDPEIAGGANRKSPTMILVGSLRLAAGALVIILVVAGLGWSIRNLIPRQAPVGSQLSQESEPGPARGVISATAATSTPLQVAILPTATILLPTQPPVNGISYVVQAGDTLSSIAYRFGISLDTLLSLNGLSPDATIYVDQILTIGWAQPVAVQPGNGLVNLRSGPGTDFPVVGQIFEGEQLAAMGKSTDGNWLMVESSQAPGGVAWVSAGFVEPGEADLPIIETPPDEATATPMPLPPELPVTASNAVTLTLVSGPTSFEQEGLAGELYFLLRPMSPPINRQLYHVPVMCLASQVLCPAALVAEFPEAEDTGLSWSADGRQAALVSSTTSQLLLYTPQNQAWSTVISPFYGTMSIALWSPDGNWVATTVQGADSETSLITLIHPGSDPESTVTRTPAADLGDVQIPLGWLNTNELLFLHSRAELKGQQGGAIEPRLYRVNLDSGEIEELSLANGWEWLKSYPAPSPDGSRIALALQVSDHSELAVTGLDGTNPIYLGVNGQMPAWSPDGQWLAYLVQQGSTTEIFISRPDGANAQKIFDWPVYPSFTWSPDSQYVLITAYPTGAEPREGDKTALYLYSIADGTLKKIRLEESAVNREFFSPSFKPAVSP